jgi:hypothetical protein
MKKRVGPIVGGLLGAALWPGVALLVTWHDEIPNRAPSLIDVPVMLLFWLVSMPGYMVPQLLFGYAQICFWGGLGALIGWRFSHRRARHTLDKT